MTQYNSLNVKLSNSQLNKLKSAIKNETEVILRLLSNMIGDSTYDTNFPHKLCNRKIANYLSIDFNLLQTQLSKIKQSGGFLGKNFGQLLQTGLPLMKNVLNHYLKMF